MSASRRGRGCMLVYVSRSHDHKKSRNTIGLSKNLERLFTEEKSAQDISHGIYLHLEIFLENIRCNLSTHVHLTNSTIADFFFFTSVF